MAISTMYPAMPGSPKTTLTADITADATSLTVADGNVLPVAPNILVIGDDENAEVIGYNSKSGNSVSGLVRALGGTVASAWATGAEVARNITSFDHDRFKENIEDLEANKANTADLGDLATQDTIDLDTQVSGILKMSNGGTGGKSSVLYLRPGDSFTIGTGVTGFPALASLSYIYFTVSTTYPIRSDVSSATLTASQIAFRTQSKQVNISNVELASYSINRCGFVFRYPNENETFATTDIVNASFRSTSGTITLS